MAYISMSGVTRVYETGGVAVKALSGVDLEVDRGELCIIVGPSGAGKTTLLNLLGGMDQPLHLWRRCRGHVVPFVPSLEGEICRFLKSCLLWQVCWLAFRF